MGKKHRAHYPPRDPQVPAPRGGASEPSEVGNGVAGVPEAADREAVAAGALVELETEALHRLEQETAEWKDRCLRAAAEFENYKKRAIRERTETVVRTQADLIARVLDVVDDLGRVSALDPGQTSSQALHEGVGLVERKLLKALEGVGLERLDPAGQPFDPHVHEAVMTVPAPTPEADHTVGSVFQLGYRLNGQLLRPARVAVCTWTQPAAEEAAQ